MVRSTILRDNTAGLVVVRPDAVLFDNDDLSTERDRVLAEARVAGYADGLAAAQVEAQNQANRQREQHDRALSALDQATSKSEAAFDLLHHRIERSAVDLGFAIAKAILVRELALSNSPGEEAIKRALSEIRTSERVVVRLHPSDVESLANSTIDGVTTIIADASIGPGGCELEVGATLIDAKIETALERVRQVLDEATGQS